MDELDILDLSNNEIEDFEGNFSAVLEDLDSLFLDGNEIQGLPPDMETLFSRLDNLTLHDNPLHCNCEVGGTRRCGAGQGWGRARAVRCGAGWGEASQGGPCGVGGEQ